MSFQSVHMYCRLSNSSKYSSDVWSIPQFWNSLLVSSISPTVDRDQVSFPGTGTDSRDVSLDLSSTLLSDQGSVLSRVVR